MLSAGDMIYRCRKYRGYTQRELAHRAGVSKSMVYSAENNTSAPRYDTVLKCLEACGFTLKLAEKDY